MGKIDEMRRVREQQFADAEARVAKAAKGPAVLEPAPPLEARTIEAPAAKAHRSSQPEAEPAQPSRPTRPTKEKKTTSSKSGAAIDEHGRCPDCGKMKPLSNGVLASHQKGFGKACSGSRKKPV